MKISARAVSISKTKPFTETIPLGAWPGCSSLLGLRPRAPKFLPWHARDLDGPMRHREDPSCFPTQTAEEAKCIHLRGVEKSHYRLSWCSLSSRKCSRLEDINSPSRGNFENLLLSSFPSQLPEWWHYESHEKGKNVIGVLGSYSPCLLLLIATMKRDPTPLKLLHHLLL